jgi:hypothetical protein
MSFLNHDAHHVDNRNASFVEIHRDQINHITRNLRVRETVCPIIISCSTDGSRVVLLLHEASMLGAAFDSAEPPSKAHSRYSRERH